MRLLRFELGEAQDTVAQTETLNGQLASDLVDTRNFKAELERMLTQSEEQAQDRIQKLENQLKTARTTIQDMQQKLDAKSEAINVLLAELTKRQEQLDSIGEIGDVIQDIDVRISEQFEDPAPGLPPATAGMERDRVTRVLVGKIDQQLVRFPLFKDRLTIGRTGNNDIQLNAAYVSRRHAVVLTEGDTTRVIDWGSKNGVFVNGKRITEHFLASGDIVAIGNAKFRYEERPKRPT
jgi:predicted phage tail protein